MALEPASSLVHKLLLRKSVTTSPNYSIMNDVVHT